MVKCIFIIFFLKFRTVGDVKHIIIFRLLYQLAGKQEIHQDCLVSQ